MADAAQRERWEHTSTQIAFLINCHRDPKKPACKPSDINPFKQQTARLTLPKQDQFALLRQVFCPPAQPKR